MTAKRIWIVASAAIALLVAAPTIASASLSLGGEWNGHQSQWFDGAHWHFFASSDHNALKVHFTVRSGKLLTFRAAPYTVPCAASGQRIVLRPLIRRARTYRKGGKLWFQGETARTIGSRTYMAVIAGWFASSRKAIGILGSRLSGCGNTVYTYWAASKKQPPHRKNTGGGGGGGTEGGGIPGCTPYIWTDSSGWPHMEYQCG